GSGRPRWPACYPAHTVGNHTSDRRTTGSDPVRPTNPEAAAESTRSLRPILRRHQRRQTELSQINADDHNLVKFVESFKYKKYTCIAFEVLDQSLLDFMEKRDFHPLTVEEIRTIAWQLIVALKGLKSVNLVHCDIKLDNIMLVDQVSEPFRVKLIDFGLAEKIGHMRTGATMQNICYRAPEVILGLPLDQSVDLWTVGYILFVLYTGSFIHGWDADYNILRAMVKMQGMPEEKVLNQGQSKKKGRLFVDLLKRMLMVDPRKRISPSEALQHPFFTMGRVQPTAGTHTTNPEEPPAVEVHLQYSPNNYPHPHPPNQTKPNQTKLKPSQTKWNQTKPSQTKRNQTKPDQTKPNQTEPDQAKPDQTKPQPTMIN
uniref:Protein kinase domain-containing protein n=1 Tax=Oryzias latipes TaxID=8090 RepID=A0A3P9JVH5_ORYLA